MARESGGIPDPATGEKQDDIIYAIDGNMFRGDGAGAIKLGTNLITGTNYGF